jgi:hypothetical protein
MEFKPNFESVNHYIRKEDILSQIGDEQIYKRFCSDFPKDLFHSPLRKDENPSFGFFYLDLQKKWLWKDHATDESGDVFQFVQKLFATDFKGAISLIANAFNISTDNGLQALRMPKIIQRIDGQAKPDEERVIIDIKPQPLSNLDYDIWANSGVCANALETLQIKATEEVWFKRPDKPNFVIWARYLIHNPVYYWSHPYTTHVKCYKPFEQNKLKKWINNCDNYKDVQGYIQCCIKEYPGRPLILTSSMKEVAFFRTFGFNAMAGHTEGSKFSPDFIRHLFKYCNPIISAYDADGPGVKAAMYLRKQYGIPLLPVCNAYHKSKDPTDLWKEDYKECLKYLQRVKETIEYYGVYQRSPGSITAT